MLSAKGDEDANSPLIRQRVPKLNLKIVVGTKPLLSQSRQ
jgi:hypothetical protein